MNTGAVAVGVYPTQQHTTANNVYPTQPTPVYNQQSYNQEPVQPPPYASTNFGNSDDLFGDNDDLFGDNNNGLTF